MSAVRHVNPAAPDDVQTPAWATRRIIGLAVSGVGALFLLLVLIRALAGAQLSYSSHSAVVNYWVQGVDWGAILVTAVVLILIGSVVAWQPLSFMENLQRARLSQDEATPSVIVNGEITGELHVHAGVDPAANPADRLSAQTALNSASLRKQESLLREIYTQGLTQARSAFIVSLFFAAIGGGILLVGVGLAVYRAPSNGQKYASIITALAGSVVSLIAALFFAQANATRRNLGEQAVSLRAESQEDRRISAARELLNGITDSTVRDKLQVDMAKMLLDFLAPQSSPRDGKSETMLPLP